MLSTDHRCACILNVWRQIKWNRLQYCSVFFNQSKLLSFENLVEFWYYIYWIRKNFRKISESEAFKKGFFSGFFRIITYCEKWKSYRFWRLQKWPVTRHRNPLRFRQPFAQWNRSAASWSACNRAVDLRLSQAKKKTIFNAVFKFTFRLVESYNLIILFFIESRHLNRRSGNMFERDETSRLASSAWECCRIRVHNFCAFVARCDSVRSASENSSSLLSVFDRECRLTIKLNC